MILKSKSLQFDRTFFLSKKMVEKKPNTPLEAFDPNEGKVIAARGGVGNVQI